MHSGSPDLLAIGCDFNRKFDGLTSRFFDWCDWSLSFQVTADCARLGQAGRASPTIKIKINGRARAPALYTT